MSLLDSVQDIRQFLLENADSCFVTSYHLVLDGAVVNDYAELLEIEGVQEGSVFNLVEGEDTGEDSLFTTTDEYDDRTARLHIRRLREILSMLPGSLQAESPSLYTRVTESTCVSLVDSLLTFQLLWTPSTHL